MVKIIIITIVLFFKMSYTFAQSDGTFLIYNAYKNRCLGHSLQWLDVCDPHSVRQQFRWTSENRIFNVVQKKCLGTGSKKEGNTLQWYNCDGNNDLMKWECRTNSLFALMNETLYLSAQDNSNSLVLSIDPGEKGKWTLHGTTESVCSRPYEEMYTLQGNSFGRPCQFPFRYKNNWYADCTKEDSAKKRLWCAIESVYEVNELWGYCPTREKAGDDSWKKNPQTNVYYQVNDQSALTWDQARKSCQQQGGDLLSITEPHEQTFISGLIQQTGSVLWTGLNSLDSSRGWHWVNGQPLRYLKWMSGQPSSLPGHSCGVLSQLYGSEWSTAVCSEKHGYICQRGLITPTVPPVVHTGSCYSPWIPYSGHCYLLSRTKKTWLEAKDACRREGGDLLSILNVEEQSFTISQLGYAKEDELWIGFNDLKTSMLFEWSDHSNVPYALWDVNEPSHDSALKEDCVILKGEEGKWADQNCQQKYGYICKKKSHLKPSTNDTVVSSPGCKPGWVRYGYYCYLAGSETKSFDEAKQMCEKTGSYLADITNRIENAFLVSLIGARPEKHFWVGLSNQKDKHTFEWTNTKAKVSFTHFNAGMPGGKQGCVAITTGMLAGLWDVLSCTNAEKYICKQKAEGVITTAAPPTTPAPSCPSEWNPVPNRDLCYKLFIVDRSKEKTWSEALAYCREVGGDLLSIHSAHDIQITRVRTAWIGYSIQDPSAGYTWSDGSSSSYQAWMEGEPNNFNNVEKCATVNSRYSWYRGTPEWNDVHCEDKYDWFCEIRKGVTPKQVEITETKNYNRTEDGWIIYKDNHYYISSFRYESMEGGRKFCKSKHGDLVVINDEEERVFLWHQIRNAYSGRTYYIGMTIDMDKSLSWMDDSPIVFQAWAQNQPAFANNDENCVGMTNSQGLWESMNCGDDARVICKRSGPAPINATVAPTVPPTGGCAPEWVKIQDKCYKLNLEKKNWTDARSSCIRVGGNLASVSNSFQQDFLTSKMANEDDIPDLWLGLNSLVSGRFRWTDGSSVTFTGWSKDEPNRYFRFGKCVANGGRQRSEPGKWVTKACSELSGYICSRALDRLITPTPTELPKTFIKLENSSYMFVQTNMTWNEAQKHCTSLGANLASIRDAFTQSYLAVQVHNLNLPLWIGLNSMETDGYFRWIDNWHLQMERWDHYEPKKDRPCVYMDVNGKWKTALCNQTYYSVCKQSTDVAPTPPTQFPGRCPEETNGEPKMTWLPYRGHCYAFVTSETSWSVASGICLRRGGSLVTIQDKNETSFLEKYISLFGNDHSDFWIGLFKTHDGHWKWLDNSVVDFTNWEESVNPDENHGDYDDDYHYSYRSKQCTVISSRTKQWRPVHCEHNSDMYICKTAKAVISSTIPSDQPVVESRTHAAVVSVVMVILVVAVLGVLAYAYYQKPKTRVASPTVVNPLYYTTETLQSEEKDTKNLVNNICIDE
ncbi:macrophage mannose receptor 1-like isoform X3 [Astyanax mexicanus]|uniref:macrophage mannose receptor 1-like isoform X3 n=1 Tax=Astyanax mexicanus TaxID=7994 RepID=UPI0020CAD555|nr:macrophage mannose receptor 1-like isoform X3 [Astyanax mexicanus]